MYILSRGPVVIALKADPSALALLTFSHIKAASSALTLAKLINPTKSACLRTSGSRVGSLKSHDVTTKVLVSVRLD